MQIQDSEAPKKRGRGGPKKVKETIVRAKDDPLRKWEVSKALEAAKGNPLVALAEKQLPDGTVIPSVLDKVSKKHYLVLRSEFEALGIDVIEYKRVHVLLSKLYAFEEMCEKELDRIGGIAYRTSGEALNYREHPAAKHLQTVRSQILNVLKSLCLTPSSKGGGRFAKDESTNEFAFLDQLQ